MMADLVSRGARLAAQRQRQRIDRVAAELRKVFSDAAVVIDEAHVLVRGKGLIKRWLVDPNLRFLQWFAR
jgi:hypothetical protein